VCVRPSDTRPRSLPEKSAHDGTEQGQADIASLPNLDNPCTPRLPSCTLALNGRRCGMDIHDVEVFRAGTHTDSAGRTAPTPGGPGAHRRVLRPLPARGPGGHRASRDQRAGLGLVGTAAGGRGPAAGRLPPGGPEFAQLLREGRFKKRSVSLFPDLRLRHVGFLGAAAPAVAGLKDVAFSAGSPPWNTTSSTRARTRTTRPVGRGTRRTRR
jgi:hypothetical protein